MKIVDLSDTLSNTTRAFEPNPHQITYINHQQSYASMGQYGLQPSYFAPGWSWAVEMINLSTHSGTHIDAPYHYSPQSAGQPSHTIDQLPLDWFMRPGVRLDFRHKPAESGITAAQIQEELIRLDCRLRPLDIVLIWTGASQYFHEPGYEQRHAGLRADATRWLLEQGIKVIGIDAWGLDRPFNVMAAEAAQGDVQQFWESHFVGIDTPYCQIEKLAHLEAIPHSTGFQVSCLPVKIEGASGAWTRAVAIVDD